MPDNVKALIVERNGTELEFHEEWEVLPENIPFSDPSFDADNVKDAIKATGDAVEHLVVPIPLIYNGSLSNGDFIGYSHLLPGDSTPIVAPITGVFTGFTWSNNRSSADFALEFRLGSTTGTVFFTWSVDNTQTADVELVVPEDVVAGGTFFVKYIDQGSNARDVSIVLKFKS